MHQIPSGIEGMDNGGYTMVVFEHINHSVHMHTYLNNVNLNYDSAITFILPKTQLLNCID